MSKEIEDNKEALDYHEFPKPGKIEVVATKSCVTSEDLAKAYTPGVAAPCLKIAKDPELAYKYTAKGNLVGVISNGSAVLGLGNIGALAGKPVMEGKGILFKRFADIDVFDIEINEDTVEGMVRTITALEPTFGGINLEDIKAPECFEVERQLVETLNIPVFHDDQHGTAIIASAAFINAVELTGKKISEIRVVFSGAGAASIACAKLFYILGVKKENLFMCDSKGVIHSTRKDGMNKYKEQFAVKTKFRTLADALDGADAFIGCSARGVLTKAMVKKMAKDPIIFAMANPEPEIYPDEVFEVRDDAIMATGRSDFPNQVNNVLGFPFIFRGALDVRATKINEEMKIAAVKALARLAKQEVPDEVKSAYGNQHFQFGKNYLIPKPFDTRVLTSVTPAVAQAAIKSGVAKLDIEDWNDYTRNLEDRLGSSASFMKDLRDRVTRHVEKKKKKITMAFAAGSNTRVLQACEILSKEQKIEPILIGKSEDIRGKISNLGLTSLDKTQIIEPSKSPLFEEFITKYYEKNQRKGISLYHAEDHVAQEDYFGSMMVRYGHADSLICGPTLNYSDSFIPLMKTVGTKDKSSAAGIFVLVFKNKLLFLADCTAQIEPCADKLSEIAISTARLYKSMLKKDPRIAFLSFSNFGSNDHPKAKLVRDAVNITKKKDNSLKLDGELQADIAVNSRLLSKLYNFSDLDSAADILIFPELNAANISYKLLIQLSDATAIGPILVPMNKAVNIIQRTATVQEIVNICTVTALLSQE